MDFEKGALMTWVGHLFIRRGNRSADDRKYWLPDLPHLSQVLMDSDMYFLTDECRREIQVLGKAAKYSFAEYLASEDKILRECGVSLANPVLLDEEVDSMSVQQSTTETVSEELIAFGFSCNRRWLSRGGTLFASLCGYTGFTAIPSLHLYIIVGFEVSVYQQTKVPTRM